MPAEILTIANHILGTGQLSLAKFLFITACENKEVSTHRVADFFNYVLKRMDLERDIHFQTNTTMDTLDYSGTGINSGSKVIFAAYGGEIRSLATEVPEKMKSIPSFLNARMILPGIVALQTKKFTSYEDVPREMEILDECLGNKSISEPTGFNMYPGVPLIIICDDSDFISSNLDNFIWVAFTRCNPSHDIHGINSFTENKHWGCRGPLIMDCRIKPHHAPVLEKDDEVEKKIDRFFQKGGPLAGLINS
jgi:4-hydroxy-3-polyprenylbenzoate decarboxylase